MNECACFNVELQLILKLHIHIDRRRSTYYFTKSRVIFVGFQVFSLIKVGMLFKDGLGVDYG